MIERDQAQRCIEAAQGAASPPDRAEWLAEAQVWATLAVVEELGALREVIEERVLDGDGAISVRLAPVDASRP